MFPTRALPDGRTLWVHPLTYGRARLSVSPPGDSYSFVMEF
jgi:hypothetical protein